LKQLGESSRGIAVIDSTFSSTQLDDFSSAGVRGVRINLETGKGRNLDDAAKRLDETAKQIAGRNWVIQIFSVLPVIEGLASRIMDYRTKSSSITLAWQKCGRVAQQGFTCLLSLLEAKKAYTKLSGPYMISQRADYSDITPLPGN